MIKSNQIDTSNLEWDYQGSNASGLRELRLVASHLVTWIDPRKTKLLPGDITLDAGVFPTNIDTEANSCGWSEDMSESVQGILYRTNISFVIPKERTALRNWIQANQQVRWIAFTQDRNGIYRVHGTRQTPLRLGSAGGAGSGRTAKSQRSFGLTAECLAPAQICSAINNEFFTQRRFTHEFDSLTFY